MLFPTLGDRLRLHSEVLKLGNSTCKDSNLESRQMLRSLMQPWLLPFFTGPKMLFFVLKQLQQGSSIDENSKVSLNSESCVSIESLWAYASALIENIWSKTEIACNTIGMDSKITSASQEALAIILESEEYKCLNVLLQAVLAWHTTAEDSLSWGLISKTCNSLLGYAASILDMFNTEIGVQILPDILEHSFVGKLLPLALLSICANKGIENSLSSKFKDIWPKMDALIVALHAATESIDQLASVYDATSTRLEHGQKPSMTDFSAAMVELQSDLSSMLKLPKRTPLSSVYAAIWRYIVASGCTIVPFDTNSKSNTHRPYRIIVNDELGHLLGTSELMISSNVENLNANTTYSHDRIKFLQSSLLLSQKLRTIQQPTSQSCSLPDPSIGVGILPAPLGLKFDPTSNSLVDRFSWVMDFQRILTWTGARYAETLINGNCESKEESALNRWISSSLFKGGLDIATDTAHQSHESIGINSNSRRLRNREIIDQILDNRNEGKTLIDKIRLVIDPNAKASADPKLRTSRLRRQDSVERTLEKSGGYEAVDKAVRSTFAVLLKHSHCSYTATPMRDDGMPTEAIIDMWRASLQLRRW